MPVIALFDVNGTLTDPAGLGTAWGRPDLGHGILAGAIETAMTETLLGGHRPLADHLRGSLTRETERSGLDPALVDEAAERGTRLAPFPDAAPALDRLRAAGIGIAALTNSGADAGRATLEAAGLVDRFDHVLGVDALGVFKPHPATYAHALHRMEAAAVDVVLVAAHGWDVAGASHAGLLTGWVARGEGALSSVVPLPDLRAADLLDMAEQLVARTA